LTGRDGFDCDCVHHHDFIEIFAASAEAILAQPTSRSSNVAAISSWRSSIVSMWSRRWDSDQVEPARQPDAARPDVRRL